MGTAERRMAIIRCLCRVRYITISKLAKKFSVSERTIRRDIEIISLTEPIYTQSGRGGGVFVVDGYSIDKMYMSKEEIALLHKLYDIAAGKSEHSASESELTALKRLIGNYSKPIK